MIFASRMPCARCGASVERADGDRHTCDTERRLEFQLLLSGSAIATFDHDVRGYLAGNEGRFEVWLAAREVRRSAG